jgi:hypothetical protein
MSVGLVIRQTNLVRCDRGTFSGHPTNTGAACLYIYLVRNLYRRFNAEAVGLPTWKFSRIIVMTIGRDLM